MRRRLKFYYGEPSPWLALLWASLGKYGQFKLARRVSKVIRQTLENAGLIIKEKNGEQTEITYPLTEIEADNWNFYLTFHMLPGQTGKQWEAKLDAFSHALGCDMVRAVVRRGTVEVVVQHTEMDAVVPGVAEERVLVIGASLGGLLKWDFEKDPHCLIVGLTGTGKSTFLRNLLTQFRDDWTLRIVDGKFVEFTFLADLGYDVATTEDQFMQYVEDAQAEVNRRFRLLQENRKNHYSQLGMQPYFLLCDEFIFLAESLNPTKKQGQKWSERDEMFMKLRDISLRGRAAGVFLILILQRPDASFMPTVIRDNLACKICLGGSETALEMCFGREKMKGLDDVPLGQGYAMISEGEVTHFRFADYSLEQFIEDLNSRKSPPPDQEERKEEAVVTIHPKVS